MDESGCDVAEYDPKWREYTVRITAKDFQAHAALLGEIIKHACDCPNKE